MSKNLNNNIAAERFARNYGRNKEDAESANRTRMAIISTYERLVEEGRERMFFNLPYPIFHKASESFTSGKRGNLTERYVARLFKFTKTNIAGRGDLTDGKGLNHEVKSSRLGAANGLFQFAGVRPADKVESFIFAEEHSNKLVTYQVPASKLDQLTLRAARDRRDSFTLAYVAGGKSNDRVAELATVREFNGSNTGRGLNALDFLAEAGITSTDVDRMVQFKEDVNAAVAGSGTVSHVSLEELLEIQPFVSGSKFGLLVQDWLTDHLEVATSRIAGTGDGVGKSEKIEIKYSSIGSNGTYQLHGIKPSEFDTLYLALNNGNRIEFFKLTRREAAFFVSEKRGYGEETNDGIFKLRFGGQNSKALKFLRRTKAVDIKPELH